MTYFTTADHEALAHNFENAHDKFMGLHQALRDQIRMRDWDLHPHWKKSRIISNASCTTNNDPDNILVLSYFRSFEQAKLVENLMGIDQTTSQREVHPYRHPVIELRLAPDHFAIELILSPYAWWDQQNFIGKFDLERQRQTLRDMLAEMGDEYRFGFWGGTEMNDMHLTSWQLLQGRILDEWMATFADGQDWMRFGMWYEPECDRLDDDTIVQETIARIGELYNFYDFLLWTSNNNYHDFYHKRNKRVRRMYA